MKEYTLKQLKGFKFEVIKEMFDKSFKRVNTFVDYKTELVKGSEKRAEDSIKRVGTELEQEVVKKQKIDDAKIDNDQEESKMKKLIKVVPDEEEVAMDDKLDDFEDKYQVYGRIVRIKSFIRLFGITVALIKDSDAQEESTARVKLVLLVENEENFLSSYYCLYTVNDAGVYVTAASVQS
ncbi:hypothetical protein Tco_1571731 [Tanacetum coccineum]